MEDFNYNRSRSHGNGQVMQMERYYGGAPRPYDLRSYSVSYAQAQMAPNKDLNKGKGISRTSISKSWSFADPEFQRKKRVASYKMYSVEGKVKGSFRKSFRWLKERYWQVVYGWW
ncbi:ATP-dependent DNA helicase Q 1 [Spatholobus suberectus]|nr:ATP-dependent DNA helicase Q 1 [Spatholobus suberectus]